MKTILITGGSDGIGYEMSKTFAQQGFQKIFWVTLMEEEARNAKINLLKEIPDVSIEYLIQDLTKKEAAKRVFEWIESKNIELDVLINNAGCGHYGMSHQLDMEKELNTIELNIIALYKLTRLFLAKMIRRDSGSIINISSNASFQPVPKLALYAASKSFVSYYSQAVNEELKMSNSNVKVITICPAAIKDTKFKNKANMENIKTFDGLVTTSKREVAGDVWNAYFKNKSFMMSGVKLRTLYPIMKRLPKPFYNLVMRKELSEK